MGYAPARHTTVESRLDRLVGPRPFCAAWAVQEIPVPILWPKDTSEAILTLHSFN